MSEDNATPETVEQATPERFDNLEDAMKALSGDQPEDIEVEDTPDQDQPEDVENEEVDQEETEEDEGVLEPDDEDGNDTESDIEPIDYDPSVRVTLEDGTESTLEDLVMGNLRQADYTRKTEALAEDRRELEAIKNAAVEQSKTIQDTYDGLVEFLQGIMPPEPSLELLGVDQAEYLRQQAIRKSFTDELSGVLQRRSEAGQQVTNMTDAEMAQARSQEHKKLLDVMPTLADDMRMAAFQENVTKTAQEFGFSAEEIGAVYDHRLLHLVHLAGVGKRSIENGKNARKRIERKAAKPAEKKPAQTSAGRTVSSNGKAMRQLAKSGSIQDAMKIDFA